MPRDRPSLSSLRFASKPNTKSKLFSELGARQPSRAALEWRKSIQEPKSKGLCGVLAV